MSNSRQSRDRTQEPDVAHDRKSGRHNHRSRNHSSGSQTNHSHRTSSSSSTAHKSTGGSTGHRRDRKNRKSKQRHSSRTSHTATGDDNVFSLPDVPGHVSRQTSKSSVKAEGRERRASSRSSRQSHSSTKECIEISFISDNSVSTEHNSRKSYNSDVSLRDRGNRDNSVKSKCSVRISKEIERKKRACVCIAILVSITAILSSVAGVIFVYWKHDDPGRVPSAVTNGSIGIVRVFVKLRIINVDFYPSMYEKESETFKNVSSTFCKQPADAGRDAGMLAANQKAVFNILKMLAANQNQAQESQDAGGSKSIDYLYQHSSLLYLNPECILHAIRPGSIRLYYVTQMEDIGSARNLTRHRVLLAPPPTSYNSASGTRELGTLLIDVNSIEMSLTEFWIEPRSTFETAESVKPSLESFQHSSSQTTDYSSNPIILTIHPTQDTMTQNDNLQNTAAPNQRPQTKQDRVDISKTSNKADNREKSISTDIRDEHTKVDMIDKSNMADAIDKSNKTDTRVLMNGRLLNMDNSNTVQPVPTLHNGRPSTNNLPGGYPSVTGGYPSVTPSSSNPFTMASATSYVLSTGGQGSRQGDDFPVGKGMEKSRDITRDSNKQNIVRDLPQLEIQVQQSGTSLSENVANVNCTVRWRETIHSVSMSHRTHDGDVDVIKTLNIGELVPQSQALTLNRRLDVVMLANGTVSLLLLQIQPISCKNVGTYICSLTFLGGDTLDVKGTVHGFAPISPPHMTLPVALVENQEASTPITCSASIGYPPGRLQWHLKPPGYENFLPFAGFYESVSGDCDTFVTSSLIFTPTRDGNRTLLRCSVISGLDVDQQITVVKEIQILPDHLCADQPDGVTLSHPFFCYKYIRCSQGKMIVNQCPDQLCFDQKTGSCGQIAVSMPDVVAFEGVASLKCRLVHLGQWARMTLYRRRSNGIPERLLDVEHGQKNVTFYKSSMRNRLYSPSVLTKKYETEVHVWLYHLTCADEGSYVCTADVGGSISDTVGRLTLRVKPRAPKIFLPNEIIQDRALRQNVTCEADVGYPAADLVLKVRYENETNFRPLEYPVKTIREKENCSTTVKKLLTFIPNMGHNHMTISCSVENSVVIPAQYPLVTMETVHVLPGDFCEQVTQSPQIHPYDCHQYIQCAEGHMHVQRCGSTHCFNPASGRCDAHELDGPSINVDPTQPCKPNKNGVFFPHPFLCNKYIWCVMGAEVVHHCPLGTLYNGDGQCTFETTAKSMCFRRLQNMAAWRRDKT